MNLDGLDKFENILREMPKQQKLTEYYRLYLYILTKRVKSLYHWIRKMD